LVTTTETPKITTPRTNPMTTAINPKSRKEQKKKHKKNIGELNTAPFSGGVFQVKRHGGTSGTETI
jgi:hypothetical protein